MPKQTAKTSHKIADKKKRGEWVELKFMAEAAERNLPTSKPLGDSEPFDVVVGRPGKFVGVQVKSTLSRDKTGYDCNMLCGHHAYPTGAFDFLAVYIVPENVWYIIPAKLIEGKVSIKLYPNNPLTKYEHYREAWELLREAVGITKEMKEENPQVEESIPSSRMEERMMASFNFVRKHWER